MHNTVILNTWTSNTASPTNQDKVTIMSALTNPDAIDTYQLCTLRSALKLEIIGMSRKGPSAYTILKAQGFKGNRQSVLDQVINEINSRLPVDWKL